MKSKAEEILMKLPTDCQPVLRITTRPNDANKSGDIFGGWLMSQIDIAGSIAAMERAKGQVVTVAVKELQFIKPIFVYDLVSFFAKIVATGRTSMTVVVDVYVQRYSSHHGEMIEKVSEATLVYVAMAAPGVTRELPKEN